MKEWNSLLIIVLVLLSGSLTASACPDGSSGPAGNCTTDDNISLDDCEDKEEAAEAIEDDICKMDEDQCSDEEISEEQRGDSTDDDCAEENPCEPADAQDDCEDDTLEEIPCELADSEDACQDDDPKNADESAGDKEEQKCDNSKIVEDKTTIITGESFHNASFNRSYVTFHVATNESVRPVIIRDKGFTDEELDGMNLSGAEIYYYHIKYYPARESNYRISMPFTDIGCPDCPEYVCALVNEEGKVVDWMRFRGEYDLSERYVGIDNENPVRTGETGVKKIYHSYSGIWAYIEISDCDAPAFVRVKEDGTNLVLREFLIESSGSYRITVDSHPIIRDVQVDIYDKNESTLLSSGIENNDKESYILETFNVVGQNRSVVNILLEKPAIIKVYDQSGNLAAESHLLDPTQDYYWVIPFGKENISRVDLEEDGYTVISRSAVDFRDWDPSRIAEFSLFENWNREKELFQVLYVIPSSYTAPEVIEYSSLDDKSIIYNVTPGEIYVSSRIGTLDKNDNYTVIIMDKGIAQVAVKGWVVPSSWGFWADQTPVNTTETEIQNIMKRAVRVD